MRDEFGTNVNNGLNTKVGIIADRRVLAVLDNGAVLDVGLACLRVVLFDDGVQQPSEGLEEVSQHGRCTWDAGPPSGGGFSHRLGGCVWVVLLSSST